MKEKGSGSILIRYWKYFLLLILFMFTVYALLYLTYEDLKREMIANLNAKQLILAKQAATSIETFFNERVAELQIVAKNEHIVDLDETGMKMMREYHVFHTKQISIITRIDREGRIIYSEPYNSKVMGKTVKLIEDFKEAKRTRQLAVSDVFTNMRGFKTIIVHVPIFKHGSFRGTLALLFPFDFIARRYIEDIRIGQDGYAWMISRNGTELSCPVPGHAGNSVFENCRDFPDIIAMAERMAKGELGIATYKFNRIRENVVRKITKQAVFMPIRLGNTFWSIVVATPEDEVLSALHGSRTKLLLVAVIFVVGTGIFFYLLFKNRILFEEVNRRRQTEEALQASEERFSKAFHISPVPTIISTLDDGRFVDVNDGFLCMMGYSREEMIAHTALELKVWVNHDDRELVVSKLKEHGSLRGVEIHLRTKSGDIRDVLASGDIISLNETKYMLSLFYDITDQRKIENQFRQSHKMEAIGTLAGGIAHDFNNILSAVIGYTEMALGDAGISNRVRSYLEQVHKAGERASALVKQILSFSRQQEQERKPVLVAPVIEEGIKMLRSSLPSTIQITRNITKSSTTVLADLTQIHQVLMNLCTNAAHAMRDKGGILDLQLVQEKIDMERMLHPFPLHAGNYVKFTVSDTGCGIDPSIMERIFDPFFTTKGSGEGTGLGLSVVYGIVRDHGGAIDITSKPGQGTIVHVYFPLAETEELLSEQTPEAIPRGAERILFVDDEAALVELGRIMLTSLGYHVTPRTSSIEALEAFKANPHSFDLVITDMTMPNMRGDDLAMKLLEIRPDIPIILCTGFSEMVSEEKAKLLGVRCFVMKPIFKKDIARILREILDR